MSKLTKFCHRVEGTNTYEIVIPSVVILPVLPTQQREYFQSFGLGQAAIEQLIEDKSLGDFLTKVLEELSK